MYALPVQAGVDGNYRFRYIPCMCTGSTFDTVEFESSGLARRLKAGNVVSGYWIAGDAASVSMPGLLAPCSKSHLSSQDIQLLPFEPPHKC